VLEERTPDLRPLPNQDERLRVTQPPGERLEVLHVIVPDRHVVAIELPEARQRSQRIEVVVEYGDLHGTPRIDHA
jgi:hypothetical protein